MNKFLRNFISVGLLFAAGAAVAELPRVVAPNTAPISRPATPPPKFGHVSGTIRLANIPNGGCTVIQSRTLRFTLNGRPVSPANVEMWAVSDTSRLTTGHGYRIKNVPLGEYRLGISSTATCVGYQWWPRQRTFTLGAPKYQMGNQNFQYSIKAPG